MAIPLLKQKPRELANQIVSKLDLSDMCETPEVAGPGFINLKLKPDWLSNRLSEILNDPNRFGIDPVQDPPITVVDFSCPNIAKQMHVGHLRSTIIGDCLANLLEFHYNDPAKIIRQNHIGDWGTQFGRVILSLWHICMAKKHGKKDLPNYIETELVKLKRYSKQPDKLDTLLKDIRDRHEEDWREDSKDSLGDGKKEFEPFLRDLKGTSEEVNWWEKFLIAYQCVNELEKLSENKSLMIPTRKHIGNGYEIEDIEYEGLSRSITAMLQKGGTDNKQERDAWKIIRDLSLDKCQEIYDQLNVKLKHKHVKGESFYNDKLPSVISELSVANLLEQSDGAQCVFMDGFQTKEGDPLPLIVQKSDGAYLYATTDLAAIRYRADKLKANRIIYVTDARQKLHFNMVFACARQAGWAPETLTLQHVPFGSVLGDDGKPFKTRSGETVKLKDLLDEAEKRAKKIVQEKNPDLDESLKNKIAAAVGIGAVKYADLSNNLISDYVFNWDKMLAMDGNTAPYMQYAYARIQSIFRKGNIDCDALLNQTKKIDLSTNEELALAKMLLRYGEVIESVARELKPHLLTNYLFDLTQSFSVFYTHCPVLKAKDQIRDSRLLLCRLSAETIQHGLCLLGIETIDKM
ncbi:MAG: arginine--tRNA ligase [Planctomycetes bacterium]|nr:arginine--tRNA ligase [Planctomycetota bacterium]